MPYQPRATMDNPYGPQVTFRTEDIFPPSALYLSMDDTVVVLLQSNSPGSVATAFLRILTPAGEVKVEGYPSPPFQALGAYNYITIPPMECYLLSMIVQVNQAAPGSIWCTCFVIRGQFNYPYSTTPPYGGMIILQGYLSDYGYLSWPNSPVIEPGTGAGAMRSISVANVTGVNWIARVPELTRWQVISCQSFMIASSAVANRTYSLEAYDQNNNPFMRFPASVNQTASTSLAYYFYNSAAQLDINASWVTAPLPTPLFLDTGWSIRSLVTNLDAGDIIANVNLQVREWVGIGPP